MSTPEHRAGSGPRVGPRLLVAAVFLVGALAGAGLTVLVAVGADDSGSDQASAADSSTPTPDPSATRATRDTTPAPSRSPSAAPPGSAEQQAQATKPLAALEPGDRVVYNMQTCRFGRWVTDDMSVALVDCPDGPPFQARIEFLVPVEPGD